MKKILLIAIPSILLLIGVSTYIGNKPEPIPVVAVEAVEQPEISVRTLFELTNAERAKAGIKPLILDERLNMSAKEKADSLMTEGWIGSNPHIEKSGKHGYEYATEYMQECTFPSENLSWNRQDAEAVIRGWMNSPPHKEALLSTRYDYVGFSVEGIYTVQHFCDID